MKAVFRILVPAAVFVWLNGCAGNGEELVEPAELMPLKNPQVVIKPLWKKQTGLKSRDMLLTPVVLGDSLIVAGSRGKLVALDRDSGKPRWKARLADTHFSAGLETGMDLLFAGTPGGEVLAMSAQDGTLRWRSRLSSSIVSTPLYEDGRLAVRSTDGKVYLLDAGSGEVLWQDEDTVPALSLQGASRPLLRRGSLVVGQASGRLVSLNMKDGERQWEAVVAMPEGRSELERVVDVDADPQLYDDVIYASAYQGRTVAVSPVSGRLLWASEVPAHTGLIADSKTLYISGHNDRVWALDRSSGTVIWKRDDLFARRISPPQIFADTLLIGDAEGYLHVLAGFDGALVGRYRVGSGALAVRPLIVDDVIYVVDQAGRVQALVMQAD